MDKQHKKLRYCSNCLNNHKTNKITKTPKLKNGKKIEFTCGIVINGFIDYKANYDTKCPQCDAEITEMSLTMAEWDILKQVSTESDFIFAMDELKKNDIVDFNLKLSQFKVTTEPPKEPEENIPKCPTCGSTNIKKISGTKRYVSTGLFGLGSSNVGKTMECNNCHYKW